MRKEDFNTLLTDLYQAYNPDYVQYVPQLVEKYSRMEFSAIDMALLKYNRKNASFYDPAKDTDEYKHFLIKEYSEGRRPLKDLQVHNELNVKKQAEEDRFTEESKKLEEGVNKTIESIKAEFSNKEKELMVVYENKIKELNELIKNVATAQPIKQGLYEDIDIKIISNYTEDQIKFPNKEALMGLGVGARIVTSTVDGSKMIGLKIMDIMYDCVSDFNGKPIIEIIIDKE